METRHASSSAAFFFPKHKIQLNNSFPNRTRTDGGKRGGGPVRGTKPNSPIEVEAAGARAQPRAAGTARIAAMNNRCGIFFGGCRNFYFSKGKFVWPRRPAKADILAEARLWSIRKRTNFCLTFAAFFTNFIRNKNVRSSIKSPSHKYVSTIRFHVVSNFNNSDAWRPCRKQLAAVSASGLHYREVFPHPSLFS